MPKEYDYREFEASGGNDLPPGGSLGNPGHDQGLDVLREAGFYVPDSDHLRPETHGQILRTCVNLALGPESRKVSLSSSPSEAYSDAIAQGTLDANDQRLGHAAFYRDLPLDDREHDIAIITHGETVGAANVQPTGGKYLAEVAIYAGPDDDHDVPAYYMGRINVEVGIDDTSQVVYNYESYRPDTDPEVNEVLLEAACDRWGIPRRTVDNSYGGVFTDQQGQQFLHELQTLSSPPSDEPLDLP